MNRQKCIVILGMHRSGTSAMAGALQECGITLGQNLMEGNIYNVKGYFENKEIVAVNNRLLESLGVTWDTSYLLPEMIVSDVDNELVSRIEHVIGDAFQSSNVFGIKDPRLSILFPLWKSVFEEAGIEPYIIHMIRDPIQVWKSLEFRDGFPYNKSSLIWLDHHLRAEKFTRGLTRVFVLFDDLLRSSRGVLLKIQEKFQLLDLKVEDDRLMDFVDLQLRHHNEEFNPNSSHLSAVSRVYDMLRTLSDQQDVGSETLFSLLDQESEKFRKNISFYTINSSNDIDVATKSVLLDNVKLRKENIELRKGQKELKQEGEDMKRFLIEKNEMLTEQEEKYAMILAKNHELGSKTLELGGKIDYQGKLLATKDHDLQQLRDIIEASALEISDHLGLQDPEPKLELEERYEKISKIFVEKWVVLNRELQEVKTNSLVIRKSLSFRIGWLLTRPFGIIYDQLNSDLSKSSTWFFLRSPGLILRSISLRNLKIFLNAIRTEPYYLINSNINKYLQRTVRVAKDGIKMEDFIYRIDDSFIVRNRNLFIRGWVLSKQDSISVELLYRGQFVAKGIRGEARPDVGVVHPGYRNSQTSGFYLDYDIEDIEGFHPRNINLRFRTSDQEEIVELEIENRLDYKNLTLNQQYVIFQKANKLPSNVAIHHPTSESANLNYQPKISILTPVYNVDRAWLDLCIESVINQTYGNWELCLYDDASTKNETIETLKNGGKRHQD
ncbi:MAG: glycosyltransferase [Saprospiraceae bacterium]|nr:glycosyltransferase [Saprospiraceae bacterium]